MSLGLKHRVINGGLEFKLLKVFPVVVAYQVAVEIVVRDYVLPTAALVGRMINERRVPLDYRSQHFSRRRSASVFKLRRARLRELTGVRDEQRQQRKAHRQAEVSPSPLPSLSHNHSPPQLSRKARLKTRPCRDRLSTLRACLDRVA